MKKNNLGLLTLLFVTLFFMQCTAADNTHTKEQLPQEQVKNVILLIGDGMGLSQIYAGITANHNRSVLDSMKHIGFSKTYSANDYVTDSAAGGTAIACGEKTDNGVIGMDTNGLPMKSILKYAADNDLSTGVVVSCELTHATPGSFIANQPSRNDMEAIADDFLKTPFTVAIGGGRDYFEKRKDGRNLTEELNDKDYQVAYTMDEVKQVTSGKLLGLLAGGPLESYPQRGNILPESVSAALNILSQNDKGFFLMVEGSLIDWGAHANDTEAIVNEVLDFNRAIETALQYAENNSGTLVVITADHETGGMSLLGGDFEIGSVQAKYSTRGHSGVMVPVFAYGTGAEEFTGIYQNTDIFKKIVNLYGFSLGN